MLNYKVNDEKFDNIKELLCSYFQISNRLLIKLKKNNKIFLNNSSVYVTKKLSIGDVVSVDIDFDEISENIVPTKMNFQIIFEDEYLLIINKPFGIPVHPSIEHYEDSLSNGVQYYFESINLKRKIRPVNRLDKDTSGIVVFAKSEYIQECLIRQMKNHSFQKEYLAILEGFLENESGTINAPIARKKDSIIERTISPDGDVAITHYKLLSNFEVNSSDDNKIQKLSLVHFKLETGRTHQIRLHSKYIGHSILGDYLYGNKSNLINRQALHAYKISFIHPIYKIKKEFEIDLPEDMKKIIF